MRASRVLVTLLTLAACNPSTPTKPAPEIAPQPPESHPADAALAELATAFEQKNATAARARLADGWSGSRFWNSWTDERWHATATALRAATLRSSTETARSYTMLVDGNERVVTLHRNDGRWLLDYNELHGPFPHP